MYKKTTNFHNSTETRKRKSPYFELERKYDVELAFHLFDMFRAFIGKGVQATKINITNFSGVIFTSRHAIDNFFRIPRRNQSKYFRILKYFCATEAVALYLQNLFFIS